MKKIITKILLLTVKWRIDMGQLNAMIYVKDVLKSVDFYKNVLGFKFTGFWGIKGCTMEWNEPGNPAYAGFGIGGCPKCECDGSHFGIHPQEKPTQVASEGILFHIQVDNVDDMYARLKNKVKDIQEPRDEPWGARLLELKDIDGYTWNFHKPMKQESCSNCHCK
jgi:uncharacterized glyoxalase superfamily protein PhnB